MNKHIRICFAVSNHPHDPSKVTRSNDRTYHVDHSQYSRTVPQLLADCRIGRTPLNTDNTKCNIGAEISREEEQLESSWKSSHIHSGRKLELPVMSLAENWRIEDVLLDDSKDMRRSSEVSLRVVVEACQSPDILHRFHTNPPNAQ